ncbi:MAG: hypothetical protein QF464_17300, partial [Myxococcota bacterium]|nr:hypothetical protein [Myxococcota bacterium]
MDLPEGRHTDLQRTGRNGGWRRPGVWPAMRDGEPGPSCDPEGVGVTGDHDVDAVGAEADHFGGLLGLKLGTEARDLLSQRCQGLELVHL